MMNGCRRYTTNFREKTSDGEESNQITAAI